MLPFNGNLTAALLAFGVAQLAQESKVYVDPPLVAMHDKVFAVSKAPPCYIGPCANFTRQLHTKKDIKRMLLMAQPEQFGVNMDALSPKLQAFFVSCRNAVATALKMPRDVKTNTDLNYWTAELSRRCSVEADIESAVTSYKAVEDMNTVLSYRIAYLMEDIDAFKIAAETKSLNVDNVLQGSGKKIKE